MIPGNKFLQSLHEAFSLTIYDFIYSELCPDEDDRDESTARLHMPRATPYFFLFFFIFFAEMHWPSIPTIGNTTAVEMV